MRFIFISNQLFDFPLKTNKWHVATRVAKLGHDVLFIDPPIRFQKLAKQIVSGDWSPRRLLTSTYRHRLERGPSPFLSVFTPFSLAVSEAPNLVDFNLGRLRRVTGDFFNGDSVLWVYNPAMIEYVERIPHRFLVYDCVDDYPSMANYARLGLSQEIAELEEKIARRADVVFATTHELARKLLSYNSNVHYVGNAGDYERFAPVGELRQRVRGEVPENASPTPLLHPKGVEGIPHPRIGFTGAIDAYKLNLPLLVKIAKAYPNYSLVLVGPRGVADTEPNLAELRSLPNVHLIDERPYEEMPAFFAGFDSYIIPYNLNDYILKGCFPVKFFDALAAGLPTVVTNLPDYQAFANVCYIARDDSQFIELVGRSITEDSGERIKERMAVAKENSWGGKVQKMLQIVSQGLGNTVSPR